MSALLQPPSGELELGNVVSDHTLVAGVRRGDDRAFETLYERYQRRIHAYVFGMVKDHQRAEDVTQEVFVSALRRMRATERPIAFKPWIYEIAKNACIDQFRRSKRAEEVSYNADDGLAPSDYGRLVSTEPVPDAALDSKQQLNDLCGAFGGLSDAHHQILVLRELEGLSYREIGERMGMSRPAVESTLFRARRRLTEEYDELASGQRCVRIQSIIANAGSGRLGARDTRRLARHVAHCQPCRREALAAGVVDPAAVPRRSLRDRAIEKVAALFPIPLLFRGRRGGSGDNLVAQLPLMSDHAAAGGAKLAAVAALVVAGLGAGVSTQVGSGDGDKAGDRQAAPALRDAAAQPSGPPAALPASVIRHRTDGVSSNAVARDGRLTVKSGVGAESRRAAKRPDRRGGQPRQSPGAAPGGAPGTGISAAAPVGRPGDDSPSGGGSGSTRVQIPVPRVELPAGNTVVPQDVDPTGAVGGVVDQANDVVQGVQDVVPEATKPVDDLLNGLTG